VQPNILIVVLKYLEKEAHDLQLKGSRERTVQSTYFLFIHFFHKQGKKLKIRAIKKLI